MTDLSDGFRPKFDMAEMRPGMQVCFIPSPVVGTRSEQIDALVLLSPDRTYTVRETEIDAFSTRISLEEKGGWFNSLFFVRTQ